MAYNYVIYDDNDNMYGISYLGKNNNSYIILLNDLYLKLKGSNKRSYGDLYYEEDDNRINWYSQSCDLSQLKKYSFENDFYIVNKEGVLQGLSSLGREFVSLGCVKIIVPYFVKGVMVKELGEDCFYGEDIEEIVLPESLIKIGKNSLASTNLVAIKIPNSCEEISDCAFSECYNLEYIDLGKKVSKIGLLAFSECLGLCNSEVFIPNTVKSMGENTFEGVEDVDFVVDNISGSISVIFDNEVDLLEMEDYKDDFGYDDDEDEDYFDEDDPYYQEYFFGAYNVNVKYLRH